MTISSTGEPLVYIGTKNVKTSFRNGHDGDPSFAGRVFGTNADSGYYKYESGLTGNLSVSGVSGVNYYIKY